MLSHLGRRLKRSRGDPGRVPPPDFRDAALFDIFALSNGAKRSPKLASALQAYRRGAVPEAIMLAAEYFGLRATPRFFANRVASHADDAQFVASVHSARDYTRVATTHGLPIYDRIAPPLRAGFPWHDGLGLGGSDLLYSVHPHRFGFLPPIALATAIGGHALEDVVSLADDWMRFAHRATKLPFYSNLIVIQRLFATLWAFTFLGGCDERYEARWRLLKVVGQDVSFLLPRLGHSYPNNHLLLDRFAAWVVALLLPEMCPGEARLDIAEKEWIAELERQTYEDGGGIEHSVHYHGLAAEMAGGYLLLSAANGLPVPTRIRERVQRMLRLQSVLCGPDGYASQIGDSSDDPLFSVDATSGGNAGALREVGRFLFDPVPRPATGAVASRTRAWWLNGGKLAPPSGTIAPDRMVVYDKGGIVVFSEDNEATRCTFRLGPVSGTHYVPGHQHADALSVTLTRHGVPLLVDAGTCTYRFDAPDEHGVNWRAYFCGPRAHNGLLVEGEDPFGPLEGDFRPMGRLPEVTTTQSAAGARFAFHEAALPRGTRYPAWTRGVVHLHRVALIVYDRLANHVAKAMHFAFQWAPHCRVEPLADMLVGARSGGTGVRLAWSQGLGPGEIVRGRRTPTNGWVSPSYGERVPAPQLLLPVNATMRTTACAFMGEELTQSLRIDCAAPSADVVAFRLRSDTATDIVIVNAGMQSSSVEVYDIAFEGHAAWIRIPDEGRPSVRWLDGRRCSSARWSIQLAFPESVADLAD